MINDETTVQRLAVGPPLADTATESPDDFLEFLRSWKGEWMWEDIHMPLGLNVVAGNIRAGSAIYICHRRVIHAHIRSLD